MKFELEKVRYIPAELQPGVLYVSKEFGIAVHLCACGCGSKIRTPLGPTEWSITKTKKGPSLYPSVGNWQEACRSHYWIREGEVRRSDGWSPEQISAGRQDEERRRSAYFARGRMRRRIEQFLWQLWTGVISKEIPATPLGGPDRRPGQPPPALPSALPRETIHAHKHP